MRGRVKPLSFLVLFALVELVIIYKMIGKLP